MANSPSHSGAMDINEVFRGGGRSVEFLDEINKACIVMLDETGIVPHAVAAVIAKGIAQVVTQERESGRHGGKIQPICMRLLCDRRRACSACARENTLREWIREQTWV